MSTSVVTATQQQKLDAIKNEFPNITEIQDAHTHDAMLEALKGERKRQLELCRQGSRNQAGVARPTILAKELALLM